MRYKIVITMLATASLAVSIPVTTLAAETTSQSLSEQGESNHTDTQEETDTISDTESEPQIEVTQSQEPIIPQLPDTLLEEETPPTSPFEIDSNGVLKKYTGTDSEVIIPDNVTRINSRAFENNVSVEKIVINESCTYIANSAISNCQNLKEVVINSKNITFATGSPSVFGTNNLKVTGYPYSEVPLYCEKFDNLTFSALEQPEEEKFTISSKGVLIRYWGNDEVVTVPDGVKTMSGNAFQNNTTMKKLILPESFTSFYYGSLSNCTALTNIDINSRETKLYYNFILNPPERIEVHGYAFSQPSYFCKDYEYLVFVPKDSVSGGIKEIPASPEKFMDGKEQKDLYKITVKDIIHSYSQEKVIERNIYVPELDKYCSPLAVNGSQFTFSANEDILSKKDYTLVSDETVEGTVNGTDIEVTFHYAYEGSTIGYTQKKVSTSYQSRIYCDVYVADQIGRPLGKDYHLSYLTANQSGESGRVLGDQYKYDAQGTLLGVINAGNSFNLFLDKNYSKFQSVSPLDSKTIYQVIPSIFGRNGIDEHVILDTTQEDTSQKYRLAYDVNENSKEETFVLKKGNNYTRGNLKVKLKQVDGYMSTPVPEVEVSSDGLFKVWGVEVGTTDTDDFVTNPVTGATVESPYGALMTIKIDAVGIWEDVLEDMKNKGSESTPAGLYAKNNGDIVYLPKELKLEHKFNPNISRLTQLQAITGGDSFYVNTKGDADVICIKNKKNFCYYDSSTGTWSNGHTPEAGELCKDSEGNVYVCQYPVGTAPDTWGYYKIPDNLLERLNKLIDFEGTGK